MKIGDSDIIINCLNFWRFVGIHSFVRVSDDNKIDIKGKLYQVFKNNP